MSSPQPSQSSAPSPIAPDPAHLLPVEPASQPVVKRVTLAGLIGSFVEWYDYGIYGLLAATLALNFSSPDAGANAALLFTYAGFAVSFVVRPFGGIVSGYLGDKIGRQLLLAWLILLISGSTAAIGVLPTYAAVGVFAPILLILLRMLQGFSAGGEASGAMSFVGEYAPDKRRGFMTSWLPVGSFFALLFGSLFASLLINSLGQDAMNSWAWRVPFLLAAPLGLVGFYIRSKLEDTPHFQSLREEKKIVRNPLKKAFTSKRHLKAIGMTIALPALNGPGYYILFVYMPTYLKTEQKFTQLQGLLVTAVGLIVICIAIPLMAILSDRIGRKPLLLWSAVVMAVAAYPCFALTAMGSIPAAMMAAAILALIFSAHAGVIQVQLVELFPTDVRYSAYAVGFNISTVIFGGTAPLLMTWLIGLTGNKSIPAYAVILTAIITTIAASRLVETAGKPLEDT